MSADKRVNRVNRRQASNVAQTVVRIHRSPQDLDGRVSVKRVPY